jgi:3-hydroxyisobutyrate dehydrogenase
MGSLMAEQLAKVPNLDLTLFDIDGHRLDKAATLGSRASSVADAADGADAIFSVVPADRHVKAVVQDVASVARPGQIYVDFSTIGPDTIESVSEQLSGLGVQTISAGMTQSLEGASTGTLRLYVGGPDALPAVVKPAFDALASEVRMVGDVRAAKALKLINNMIVACLDVAICEALVLGERYGLDYQETADALEARGADSWPLHHHIISHVLPNVLGEGFFSTRFLIKDMTLCAAFLQELGLPALFPGVAMAMYRGTTAIGHGDDYHMSVVRWLERGANFSGMRQPPADAVRLEVSKQDVGERLARAVAAVQLLVSVDAVRALHRVDVDKIAAAKHLEAGSAGNDALRELIAGEGNVRTTPARLIAALEPALELARDSDIPALDFEIAKQAAIGLADRFQADANLWSTISL